MTDFRDRVSDALRARMSPKRGVAIKRLGSAIGRSAETIRLWLNGAVAIKAEDLAAVARYLKDPTLISDVFRDLDGSTSPHERFLWFTDAGFGEDAPRGHGDFARRQLGLSPHFSGDSAAYAMRNFGWVELAVCGVTARLRYHAKGVKRSAAQAARGWLLDRQDRIVNVSRAVLVDFEWADAAKLTVASIASELELAAPAALPPLRKSERKALDLLSSRLGEVLRTWGNEPGDALRVAAAVGLAGRSNIFAADDAGNVICRRLGSALAMPHQCVGANLLAWSDPAYSVELRHAILESREDGPTYTDVRSPIFGPQRHFARLSLPIGDTMVTVTEGWPN